MLSDIPNGETGTYQSVSDLRDESFRYRHRHGHWAAEIRVTGRFRPCLEDGATPIDVVDRKASFSDLIIWIHAEDGPGITGCVAERPFTAILMHPERSSEAPAEETTP